MDKNAERQIIGRVTPPSFAQRCAQRGNDEGSELCAADGWIDEGWEHVTGTLSKLSASVVFTGSPIIHCLRPIIDTFGLGLCGLAVLSVEVR